MGHGTGRSELDKMLAGDLYDWKDPELLAIRNHARNLLLRYNTLLAEERMAERTAILGDLLGSVGAGANIQPPFFCDYGRFTRLGHGVFINFNCVFLDCNWITIGDETLLAPGVMLLGATHPTDAATRAKGPEYSRPITIGRRAWLGAGVIVLPGVTIGDDTTVGAGSVVTRDLPAGVVAAGNPCRVLREA